MATVSDPIHLPCPDMVGMVNPDSALTQKNLERFQKLRAKLSGQVTKKQSTYIPARFRQGGAA
ncbi:hypothetical protein [Vibrio nigripulchritudo]|uniref:hypothetical protein n=1 Tax=Vibrio nigripulchritudo TaxID=28173 RepID=UPI000571A48F|nr:hypothetical protein [Vibrio nigripulchritudo]